MACQRKKWMLALLTTSALSGCLATTEAHRPEEIACVAFGIIRPAQSDTVDTKRQVLAHNETYRALCPQPITQEGS
jgi:hypothetical protein